MNDIKFTQNFLKSRILASELIEKSNISENDVVLDIGAGKGIITEELAIHFRKVIAIEIDKALFEGLKNKFCNTVNVQVVNQDFLRYKLPSEKYSVFSNIPFNITANIIQKLLMAEKQPQDIYLIMQYEAVLKYAGKPFYDECLNSLIYKPLYNMEIYINSLHLILSPIRLRT